MLHLDGHQGTVHALAFAPDGQALFSAGADATVRAWGVTSASERLVLRGHSGRVVTLAPHPNGRVLASGGADRVPHAWDLKYGTLYKKLEPQKATITGLVWLPMKQNALIVASGERLGPGGRGGLTLNPLDDTPASNLNESNARDCWTLAVSPASRTVAWGGVAHQVTTLNVTHQRPKSFRQSVGCLSVALSADGKLLASGADWDVKLWDVAKGTELATIKGHKGQIGGLAFAPDGRTLASASRDGSVRFWTIGAGAAERVSYNWDIGSVYAVTFSPDGLLAAAAGDSGRIVVWDVDE